MAKRLESPPGAYRAVSRKHAEIFIKDGKVFVVDIGSKFGTKLSGGDLPDVTLTVGEPQELTAGRTISLDQEQPALTIEVISIAGQATKPSNLTTRA